ncbi:MAG: hypothetical protein RDU13_02810 [Elusimicrobiales bacterium]|nr:hypothetical protein [Elusimicrobiales bacterium]
MPDGFDPFELMKYFWVLAYGAIIAVAYLIGKLTMRKRLNKLREIAPFLGAQAVSGFMGPRLEGVKGGRKFRVEAVPGGKNSPPVLKLVIDSLLPVSFEIQRPGPLAGLLASFIRKAETGDRSFDEEFLSASPDPVSFAAFFADSRRRDAARRLLERGYERIEAKKGTARAFMPAKDLDSALDAAAISAALDELAGLSA